jgi:peptidoglycan/LPS O-acetylase OafA/YrhL
MSYTLYLVHLLTWNLLAASPSMLSALGLSTSGHAGIAIAGFLLSVLLAMAIWHLFEKPIYALRRYLPYYRADRLPRSTFEGSAASSDPPTLSGVHEIVDKRPGPSD